MQKDGSLVELSKASLLVRTITGKDVGDSRFFFPKEMLQTDANVELFKPIYDNFQRYINNDTIINLKENQ